MKKLIIYSLLAVLTVIACKKKEEIVYGTGTTLNIEITDENGVSIQDEIQVYLYDDESQYLKDLANEKPVNFIYQTTSSLQGLASFDGVKGDVTYFIYINYDGKGYQLNNFFSQYTLENPLLENAITSLNIQLEPFNVGKVAFWTNDENLASEGINIYIGDSLIGTLDGVKSSSPNSVDDTDILPIFNQSAGTYEIQAKSESGCFWAQTIEVSNNEFTSMQLTTCETGSVIFWAKPDVAATNGTLSFYINEENEASNTLTSGRETTPVQCDITATDYLTISKPTGDYSYKVMSSKSECVWVGTFTVEEGCGEIIEISNCQ